MLTLALAEGHEEDKISRSLRNRHDALQPPRSSLWGKRRIRSEDIVHPLTRVILIDLKHVYIHRCSIVLLVRNYHVNTTPRFRNVPSIPGDNMDMGVHHGLAGMLANIDT